MSSFCHSFGNCVFLFSLNHLLESSCRSPIVPNFYFSVGSFSCIEKIMGTATAAGVPRLSFLRSGE